jgi:signal transduction histidine kinase
MRLPVESSNATEKKRLIESNPELRRLQDELASELRTLERLYEFGNELLLAGDHQAILERTLDELMGLLGADFGTVQVFDHARGGLVLTAQRNFQLPFLDYFAVIRDLGTAAARAARTRKTVSVDDVETDGPFAPHRPVAREAGFRAVYSTPLLDRKGELLGVISVHFREPGHPPAHRQRVAERCVRFATHVFERNRSDDERSQAQLELAHAMRLRSMGEFAASIAHEVNQPLAAIATNGNAAMRWLDRETPDLEQVRASLDLIQRDAARAGDLVRHIRGFFARQVTPRALVDVNEVVRDVLEFAGNDLAAESVEVRALLADTLPPVIANRIELQQVLMNLVQNSLDALRPVVGRTRVLSITSARGGAQTLEVVVSDNGVGADPADLPRLFEAFFTSKPQGMGLGLSICRRIVESHGGRLRAQPNPPHGLSMAMSLPIT